MSALAQARPLAGFRVHPRPRTTELLLLAIVAATLLVGGASLGATLVVVMACFPRAGPDREALGPGQEQHAPRAPARQAGPRRASDRRLFRNPSRL